MSRFWVPALALVFCGLVLALLPTAAEAQVLYGSIVGNVKDPTGAAVPGATVTITHRQTNQARRTITNDTGAYTFSTVSSGSYSIQVAAPGFTTFVQEQMMVAINDVTRVDVTLKLGSVSETVVVTAETATLQTDRSDVRAEITSEMLENLPMPEDRNYQSLFLTIPGFAPPDQAHSIPSNPSRAMTFNVNGVSRSGNNTRIDGATGTNVWLPHMTSYIPAAEAIETVSVVTNSFDAEVGLAGGAAINVQIKSGSNSLHGSSFLYHNDNSTNAKAFITPADQRNPKRVFNQFGLTVGGPIKRDKVFFFLSYEGTRDRQHDAKLATVPVPEIRRGDFSTFITPGTGFIDCDETPRAGCIYDRLTGDVEGRFRAAFPNNIIPEQRIDPIARKIARLFPEPTFPRLTNNYYANAPFRFDRNTLDTKINWTVGDKFTMYARLSKLGFHTYNRQYFGDELGGPPIHGGNPGNGFGYTWSTTLAATYVATPRLVVDAYFGWTLMDTSAEQPLLDRKIGLDELGIPGTNGPRKFEGGWPRFAISNYTTFGINEDFMPYYRHDPQYQYVVNASWSRGNHNLRFGGEVYKQMLNHAQPEFSAGSVSNGAQGGFAFAGGPTQIRGGPGSNQFNTFATFLLGYYTGGGKILQVPDVYTTRTWLHSYYVRDRWNATRRLTLSYGVRYEYFPMPTREDRGLERYDFANNKMLVCGIGVVPRDCGVDMGWKYFAPRFGIAYRLTDRFVIRTGYGITNDPYNLARSLRTNHPLLLAMIIPAPITLQPAGTLREGLPPMTPPDLGNGVIDIPGNIGVNSLGEKFRRGYIQSWNLTLERQLGRAWTVGAAYVASRSVRQLGFLDLNAGRVGGGQASRPYVARFGRGVETQLVTPLGTSKYDGLQVQAQHRFTKGFQFRAAYTFSKSLGIAGNDNSDGNPRIQDPDYFHLNRSVTGYHRPHNLQLSGSYQLPFGRRQRWLNRGGLAAKLAGGWQMNALFSAISGSPFSVSSSGTSLNAPGSSQRADQVKPEVEILHGTGPGQPWFDPFAFATVRDVRFGNAGFNTLHGPGTVNVNVGFFREIRVRERYRVQLRAESFNFTNTPHFGNPSSNISNLQLNPDGSFRSGVAEISGTRGYGRDGLDHRVFRFALRVSF